MRYFRLPVATLLWAAAAHAAAEEVGCVSTVFKMLGPNDKICIESFRDPDVEGVVCHVSRARTGGMKGAVGLAEDTSDASIACRQVGPISFTGKSMDAQEEMFNERISVLFKKLRVVRMLDRKRNVLVYLTYSDKLIDGSPQNGLTAVALGSVPLPPQ